MVNILRTEDLGKQFEMAVCLAYNIPYIGKYKYGLDKPTELVPRVKKIKQYFPDCTHTAQKGSQYDFTSSDMKHLSVKSTKKVGMIAPQVIGQASIPKFCEMFDIKFVNNITLKEWIQTNIKIVLRKCEQYTFDCPILYYNDKTKTMKYITKKNDIDWDKFDFTFSRDHTTWKNSTLIKTNVSIAEMQFHTKTRKNIVFRWKFEEIIKMGTSYFDIIEL